MWPSDQHFNWNSVDVGPHRDVTAEISAAVKAAGMHSGLYHSLLEWYNPVFLADIASNFTTRDFAKNTMAELRDLVTRYEPDLLWSDGDWVGPDSYWNAPGEFLAWLVNESPVKDSVVFNDRWGIGDTCHHGSFLTCSDRYSPTTLQPRKWENAMTLDYHSWGYRRNAPLSDYMPLSELLRELASTLAYGGNLLINVGPALDGTIPVIMEERLLGLGAWLAVNGEGVYGTSPWTRAQNESAAHAFYTAAPARGAVYVHLLAWPRGGALNLTQPVAGGAMSAQLFAAQGALPVAVAGTPGAPGLRLQL